MIKKLCRGCVHLFGGLGAGLAIIALLIAWQLNRGPISLSFLTPYVQEALNSGHRSFVLAFDDTTLTWAGWDRTIELRITNVRAVDEAEAAIARIPELSLSLSGEALLKGELAPRHIELLGLDLKILREAAGGFDFAIASDPEQESTENVAAGLIKWLLEKPAPGSPMSYLETVRITGATLEYEDQVAGRTWYAPVGHLRLDRAAHGLLAGGSVVIDVAEHTTDIAVTGSYHQSDRRLNLSTTFNDLAPAAFADFDPSLHQLVAVDAPLSGTIVFGMSVDSGVETVGLNLVGGKGEITLPAPAAQTMAVERMTLRGLFNGAANRVVLDEFTADFAANSAFIAPLPEPHDFPISSIKASGAFDIEAQTITVEDLFARVKDADLTVRGSLGLQDGIQAKIAAELSSVNVDDVATYWPSSLGNDAWVWVTSNLSDGKATDLRVNVETTLGTDLEIRTLALDGSMQVNGMTVEYVSGLPIVRDAAGLITFNQDAFDIAVERGRSGDVRIAGGTIHLSGLREIDQYADIDLRIESPIPDALALIDHEPLGFMEKMGIKPEDTSGEGEIDLKLRLLLAKDLQLDDVDVSAAAALRNVSIRGIVLDRDIDNAVLDLKVDKQGMDVSGFVEVGPIPANLSWRENFADDRPFKSRYVLDAAIADVDDIRHMGIDADGLTGDYVAGGADARVRYTIFDDRRSRVEVFADIAAAELQVPLLQWRKAPGDPGRAAVTILIENGTVKDVPEFTMTAGDMSVAGDIDYGAAGLGMERVNFDRIRLGRTNVSGALIAKPDGGWEVGLQGGLMDVTHLWDQFMEDRAGAEDQSLPNLTVVVEFDQLWLDQDRYLSDVSGTFVHRHDLWRTVFLDSKINGTDAIAVRVSPDDSGNRTLLVRAENAGDTLRFFELYDEMYEGKMEIRGRFDDAAPGNPLRGKLRVVDYRIRNAPVMAQILSIMALTGIVDAMTGDGLSFSELDAPFGYREGELQINDAKATGASLGLTASGVVYTHADVLNLEGTVVPAYALNSLLGRIPLIGNIFTGTEDGGGVFAANFSVSGPTEDPTTTVNPLSALTPGILRNLIGSLDGKDQRSVTQPLFGDEAEPVIEAR